MNTEQFIVEGKDFSRTVWFSAGPKQTNHPLCVFLDGEYYLNRANALSILEKSIASRQIPHMSFVFVASNGPKSRHEDFTCNNRFAKYVVEDIVPWARNRLDSISSEGNVICGLSLSGLASAYISSTYPRIFSASLCQSGSFWWDRNRFASLVSKHAPIGSRFWLSVGDKEIEEDVKHPPTDLHQEFSQIVGVQSAVDALRANSAEVRHHLFSGGHEFGPWSDELADALHWLMTRPEDRINSLHTEEQHL